MSSIALNLPPNVHLLTLEPWHESEWLVRFEHILEKDEDKNYSKTVKFDLNKVFANVKINRVRETTLDGNQWLDELNQLKFKKHSGKDGYEEYGVYPKSVDGVYLLNAAKPILNADFSKELLTNFNLGAESNRLKREDEQVIPKQLNKERMIELDSMPLKDKDGRTAPEDDNEFTIELQPMQIRTFIVFLSD